MNFSILRGWCGRNRKPADAARGPAEPSLAERILIRQAEQLREQVANLQRELEAEMAENARLVAALTNAARPYDPGRPGAPPLSLDDAAHWRAEAERHKATAAKLDNLLAAAEGRPVLGTPR